MTTENINWYAGKTRANQELAIKKLLDKLGVENFVPSRTEVRNYSGRRRMVEKPIIPNIVFVRTTKTAAYALLNDHGLKMSYMIDHVTRRALIIPQKQMADFQLLLGMDESEDINITTDNFAKGDKVVVTEGDFCGIEGELIRIEGKSHLLIRLQGIINITAKVGKGSVRKV